MRQVYSFLCLTLCIVLFVDSTLMAQSYTVTDLGTLGGTQSTATDINQAGDITGSAYRSCVDCYPHAYLYKNGKMRDLGALSDDTQSAGLGISGGKGEGKIRVTGYSYTQPCVRSDCGPIHAFLYSDGRMRDLGTLSSGGDSEGFAVNSSGQVTGWTGVENAQHTLMNQHAFLYSKGKMQDLGTLQGGTSSFGTGINDGWSTARNNGVQVTGYSSTASGFYHAFIYQDDEMEDLGTLPGGSSSLAFAINQFGDVVGSSTTAEGSYHAFLYSRGHMRDLGTLPDFPNSAAEGINDYGDVVGSCLNIFVDHAFLYRDGRMYDLETMIPEGSGWELERALAINNDGEITGTGRHNGTTRGYLLTPVRKRGWMAMK